MVTAFGRSSSPSTRCVWGDRLSPKADDAGDAAQRCSGRDRKRSSGTTTAETSRRVYVGQTSDRNAKVELIQIGRSSEATPSSFEHAFRVMSSHAGNWISRVIDSPSPFLCRVHRAPP
jgi:hypothetical protein